MQIIVNFAKGVFACKIVGVESVKTDCSAGKLTVVGKVDPVKIKERVEEKTKKKVELLSFQPNKPSNKEGGGGGGGEKKSDGGGGEKKSDGGEKKADDKKSEAKSDDKKSEDKKEKAQEKPKEVIFFYSLSSSVLTFQFPPLFNFHGYQKRPCFEHNVFDSSVCLVSISISTFLLYEIMILIVQSCLYKSC